MRSKRGRAISLLCAGALVLTGACGERLERKDVDGVDCVVVKNGTGQAQFVDCDWDNAKPSTTDVPG